MGGSQIQLHRPTLEKWGVAVSFSVKTPSVVILEYATTVATVILESYGTSTVWISTSCPPNTANSKSCLCNRSGGLNSALLTPFTMGSTKTVNIQ